MAEQDPVLAAIGALGGELRAEIRNSRAETLRLVEGLQAEILKNRADTARLVDGLRADTSRLIEGVQTRIDTIREDITVNIGATDNTRQLIDNTRDELRALADLVAAMQRARAKHGSRLDQIERRTGGGIAG